MGWNTSRILWDLHLNTTLSFWQQLPCEFKPLIWEVCLNPLPLSLRSKLAMLWFTGSPWVKAQWLFRKGVLGLLLNETTKLLFLMCSLSWQRCWINGHYRRDCVAWRFMTELSSILKISQRRVFGSIFSGH